MQTEEERKANKLASQKKWRAKNKESISFEVIYLTNDINDARVKEQKVISWYGLDNLLNTNNPKLGE